MSPAAPIENNERRGLCASCGGECCRTRPGIESPDRFLALADPVASLAAALDSGDWVLARRVGIPWDGSEPPPPELRWRVILYPRPATVAERQAGRPFTGGENSPCVFLGEEGCRLSFEERPLMCQSLEPWADGECQASWDQSSAALAWLPHQALVEEAVRRTSLPRPASDGFVG